MPHLISSYMYTFQKLSIVYRNQFRTSKFVNFNFVLILVIRYRKKVQHTQYLPAIKSYRQQIRSIRYLYETLFDTRDNMKIGRIDDSKMRSTEITPNKIKTITVLYTGSIDRRISNCSLLSAKNIKDSSLNYFQNNNANVLEILLFNNVTVTDNNFILHYQEFLPFQAQKTKIKNVMLHNVSEIHSTKTSQQELAIF